MLARLSAFVIWGLVAGVAMFWGLRLLVRPISAPANAVAVSDAGGTRGDLSRLLGAEEAPVAAVLAPESSRFKLLGLMAGKSSTDPGVALISVDGKPPRPFAAGALVADQFVLQSMSLRSVSLGPSQGQASVVLEIPAMSSAATGTLTSPDNPPFQTQPTPTLAPPPPPAAPPPDGAAPPRGLKTPGGRPPSVR